MKAEDNQFPYLTGAEQGSNPATPGAGLRKLFPKADGWYDQDDAGTVTGPLGAGGGGGATFVGARVYNSANISVASGGAVLTFDSERYDTDTIHSTSSNTGRLTATTAGKYHISGAVLFANNTTGARGLQIQLNAGATNIAIERVPAVGGTDTTGLTINTVYDLAAGDYVQLFAYQTSGGALDVLAGAAYSPEFMMHKVG